METLSRAAKPDRVVDLDRESETDRRLEMAAQMIARIAVRIVASGSAKEQPISDADEQQAA